jgi:hypothetical protein
MGRLEQYYRINQATGIHIHVRNDGSMNINLCGIAASGNQLQITKKITDLKSVGQLKDILSSNSIVALNLSGKGILQKRIERIEEVDQNAFNRVLPNANPEDFYTQNFASGQYSFVSVIRKTEADKWISQLHDLQLVPLMLSLGPFPVEMILPQLNVYENELQFDGFQLARNDKGEWTDQKYDEVLKATFPIKLASEKIDEKLILPYASAFQLVLFNSLDPINTNAEELEAALQKKLTDQKAKAQSVVVLIVLFALLLINFILFSWLNSFNNQLTEQVSRYAQNSSNQQQISEDVKSKEAKLKSLGWDGGVNKGVLIDQISSLLPPEITLKEIAINPVDLASTRSQKSLVFYDRKIWITGISQEIVPVNEWMARIKTRPWVRNIQLASYAFNSELNSGQFIITINY